VTRVKEYRSATHKFKCAALAHDSELLVTGDDNKMLNLWSFAANAPILVGTTFSPMFFYNSNFVQTYSNIVDSPLRSPTRILVLTSKSYLPDRKREQ
jgi:hypothetical protein